MWLKKGNKKKSGGKKIGKNHNKEQILNMFKKSANLKFQIWLRSYIWLRSNMVVFKYGHH